MASTSSKLSSLVLNGGTTEIENDGATVTQTTNKKLSKQAILLQRRMLLISKEKNDTCEEVLPEIDQHSETNTFLKKIPEKNIIRSKPIESPSPPKAETLPSINGNAIQNAQPTQNVKTENNVSLLNVKAVENRPTSTSRRFENVNESQ